MNRFFKILTVLLCLNAPAKAALFKAETFTLPNGLQCVVVENHKSPIVKQMLWYKVGAADETAFYKGGAHLLEHLMFRGTSRVPDGEFNRIMEKNGADSNAFTGHDMTAYHQMADVSRLEVMLALEADRMHNLSFDEEAFKAEQKIVLQERKQVIENKPSAAFTEKFNKMLWGNSPYGHPVTGLSEEIESLTFKDTRDFYQRYYAPNNAILILSGDIDVKTAKPLVEKYFAEIEAKDIQRRRIAENTVTFTETLEMSLQDIQTAKMIHQSLLPPYKKLSGNIYDYLVLAEYLGGGETSALYKELVIRQKTAVSVSAGYRFTTGGNSVFSFSMIPAKYSRKQIAAAWQQLDEVGQSAVNQLNDEKLAQIKRKILAGLVYVNDNPTDAAYWIGNMMVSGFTLDDIQNYENHINEVTVDSVKNAFLAVQEAPVVRGVLLPEIIPEDEPEITAEEADEQIFKN